MSVPRSTLKPRGRAELPVMPLKLLLRALHSAWADLGAACLHIKRISAVFYLQLLTRE